MGKEYHGELTVASRGIFYEDMPDGILQCEPWGSEEEQLLISPSVNYNIALDKIIKKCTDCKVPAAKLIQADRQHIFFYLRCLSYGGAYKFPFRCSDCSDKAYHNMSLETGLDVIYIDNAELMEAMGFTSIDAVAEPFMFTLPERGKEEIGWRLLRGEDERTIDRYTARSRKRGRSNTQDFLYRMALRIVTIAGEEVKLNDALAFIKSDFKGRNALAMRQEIEVMNLGLETEIEAVCHCGYPNDILLPMDKSFFRPSGRVAHRS